MLQEATEAFLVAGDLKGKLSQAPLSGLWVTFVSFWATVWWPLCQSLVTVLPIPFWLHPLRQSETCVYHCQIPTEFGWDKKITSTDDCTLFPGTSIWGGNFLKKALPAIPLKQTWHMPLCWQACVSVHRCGPWATWCPESLVVSPEPWSPLRSYRQYRAATLHSYDLVLLKAQLN